MGQGHASLLFRELSDQRKEMPLKGKMTWKMKVLAHRVFLELGLESQEFAISKKLKNQHSAGVEVRKFRGSRLTD